MRPIVSLSLRFRVLVLGLVAALMILGVVLLPSAPVDTLPEISPPYVEVQTEALGLSADEVEQLITVPLLYRDPTAADLDRMELWARQAIADAGRAAELRGDVAVLETIWNRIRDAVDPARTQRIVPWLDGMRIAADDGDLDAVVAAARSLSGELMEVLTDAG